LLSLDGVGKDELIPLNSLWALGFIWCQGSNLNKAQEIVKCLNPVDKILNQISCKDEALRKLLSHIFETAINTIPDIYYLSSSQNKNLDQLMNESSLRNRAAKAMLLSENDEAPGLIKLLFSSEAFLT